MSWDGLLLIDKPRGETSHTIVQIIKRRLKMSKAGHLGTLDPLATGVFPVCLGKATRLAPFYMGADKWYTAAIRFGFFTNTDDQEGKPEGPSDKIRFSKEELQQAVGSFQGEFQQRPPAFSAKKTKGKKAYELARKGIDPDLPLQQVHIYNIDLLRFEKDLAVISLHCASGTYVRSIARELGVRLSCGAHVAALTRTRFNHFSIEGTCSPEAPLKELQASFIPIAGMLTHFPEVILNPTLSRKISNGSPIDVQQSIEQEWVRVFNEEKALLALARVESKEKMQRIQPKIVFS